jgi:hypothetical protein
MPERISHVQPVGALQCGIFDDPGVAGVAEDAAKAEWAACASDGALLSVVHFCGHLAS